ncbi:hypothetical protein LMH87_000206 [Akanthomyces muscarius]|uniref:Uncharacterized protein n=1 Tax=Akanthomyces muscarius TaxID=2231603 RepID=A0A9W8QGU6_AKAMU|nr:hypothetical protein LMH87_000206 [Akanthomyces muscarius]KAJ4154935.1 hypothetical protein LMH87_000206 [Akanthomyces muscarius]
MYHLSAHPFPLLLSIRTDRSFHHHHHDTIPPTKTPWPGPSFHVFIANQYLTHSSHLLSLTVFSPRPEPTDPTHTAILDGPRKLDQPGLVHLSIFSYGYGELSAPARTTCFYSVHLAPHGLDRNTTNKYPTAEATHHQTW